MTLYAQWKKNEPAPQPKPTEPSENTQKPAQKKAKSAVPATGDATNVIAPVVILVVAAACIVLGVLAKNKKK